MQRLRNWFFRGRIRESARLDRERRERELAAECGALKVILLSD